MPSSACCDKVWTPAICRCFGEVSVLVSNHCRCATHHCKSAYLLCTMVWNKLLHFRSDALLMPQEFSARAHRIPGQWREFDPPSGSCAEFDCTLITVTSYHHHRPVMSPPSAGLKTTGDGLTELSVAFYSKWGSKALHCSFKLNKSIATHITCRASVGPLPTTENSLFINIETLKSVGAPYLACTWAWFLSLWWLWVNLCKYNIYVFRQICFNIFFWWSSGHISNATTNLVVNTIKKSTKYIRKIVSLQARKKPSGEQAQ